MASNDIFEKESVSSAIIKLAIPTIVSSLVTVIYNLADTYFVGLLNDPVQTAAVTLALLRFSHSTLSIICSASELQAP